MASKSSPWRRIQRVGILLVLGLVLAGGVTSWMVGSALISDDKHPVGAPPDDLAAESVTLTSPTGARLSAWHVSTEASRGTVILLHPIRADRRSMLDRARALHSRGYSTFLLDLQAHGESEGDNITAGYLESQGVVAAVEYLKATCPSERIAIIGWSLGGAATVLASPLDVDAIILELVYPTISDAIHNRIELRVGSLHHVLSPLLLWQLKPRLGISPEQLRPIDSIGQVGCPVLILCGENDLHTKLEESQRFYEAARPPKEFVVFPEAAHVDLYEQNQQLYESQVFAFLDKYLDGGQAQ